MCRMHKLHSKLETLTAGQLVELANAYPLPHAGFDELHKQNPDYGDVIANLREFHSITPRDRQNVEQQNP